MINTSVITLCCLLIVTFLNAEVRNVPDQYETIQAAIDDSEHGDSILVAEGEYEENIDFNDVNVRVIGTPHDPDLTVIDGSGNDCVVKITGGQSEFAWLSGFTIRNGETDGYGGGGVYVRNSRPVVKNLYVQDCSGARGGGILIRQSNATIENVRLTENTAQAHGGGIAIFERSGPNITNVFITNNEAVSGNGGGIANYSSSSVDITGGLISENSARLSGGGVYSQANQIDISGMVIRDNSADEGKGGGIYANGHIILARVSVVSNSADENGGGIYINGVRPNFERVNINANQCGEFGGGIYLTGNVAGRCNPDLVNITLAGNSAESDGGGIYCQDNGNPVMRNNIIWGNEPQQIAFNADDDECSISYTYCDIQGGADDIEHNDNGDIEVGAGNIDEDPLFENPDELDFRLSWENFPEDDETKSPCIDAGNPNLGEDPDGSVKDMGGQYFHQTFPAIEVDPPERLDFGDANPANQDTVILPIRISNPGDARLAGVLRIEPDDSPFSIMRQDMNYGVQPGSDIVVLISFIPEIRGEYDAVLHISHNIANQREVEVTLIGIGTNSPPEVVGEIEDVNIIEDADWTFVADMNDVFRDLDGDQLEYVVSGSDDVNFDVRENSDLFISPDPDYNTHNLNINVMAQDGFNGESETIFTLIIAPLNDPPEAFDLQSPEDGFTINEHEFTFDWQDAAQNRWEVDEVRYTINFYTEEEREFSLETNESNIEDLTALRILTGLDLTGEDMPVNIQWDVDASDDSSSVRSNQRWEFVLDALRVPQPDDVLPTELKLYQSFPNPFNSSTTITYAVPAASELTMTVYNSSGAVVDRLFTGISSPGIHEVNWNAEKMPPGLYFLHLDNGLAAITQKVTLIK